MLYILHGGFDEKNKGFLNDLHILNICNMTWNRVTNYGHLLEPRSMHFICNSNTKCVIFGGLNDNGYINYNVTEVERGNNFTLDTFRVSKKLKQIKLKKNSIELLY